MARLIDRVVRAARLDPALYEEVEADKSATGQAALVVVASSAAAGIGLPLGLGFGGVVLATVSALVGWLVWSVIIFVVGTKLLPEPDTQSDVGEVLRVLGFASAPGLIRIVGIVDGLAAVATFVAAVWMIAAMVIAVRQAMDYTSTRRAVSVCLIGFFVQLLVALFLGLVAPPSASA